MNTPASPRLDEGGGGVHVMGWLVVLFVLSSVPRLVDAADLAWIRPLDGAFRGGNIAVSGLLAGVGFTATRAVLGGEDAARATAMRHAVSYVLNRATLVMVVVTAILVVGHLDPHEPAGASLARDSIWSLASFRWNAAISENPLGVRPDLTPLWYFSVELQLVVLLLAVLLLIGRRPWLLAGISMAGAGGVYIWRFATYADTGWFAMALSQEGRADAFLLGTAGAAASIQWKVSQVFLRDLAGALALVFVGLVIWSSTSSADQYFRFLSPVMAVLVTVLLLARTKHARGSTLLDALAEGSEGRRLGEMWPHLLAWSGPVSIVIARQEAEAPAVFIVVAYGLAVGMLALFSEFVCRSAARGVHVLWAQGALNARSGTAAAVSDRDKDRGPRGESSAGL